MKEKFNFKPYIISAIIGLAFGAGFTLLTFFAFKKALSDGLSIAGIFLVSAGLLIFVAREGFFDIFVYGVKQVKSQWFSKQANEYNNFAEYKETSNQYRKKKSKYYISLIIVGCLFLLSVLIIWLVTGI